MTKTGTAHSTIALRLVFALLLVVQFGCRSGIQASKESGRTPATNVQAEPVLVSLLVMSDSQVLELGAQLKMKVIGVYSDDSRRELTDQDAERKWSVESTAGSATIDPDTGVLTTKPSDRLGVIRVTVTVATFSQSIEITVTDTTPPKSLKVVVLSANKVELEFNEPLTKSTNAGDFTVSGTGMGTLSQHPASVTAVSAKKVILNWTSGELRTGGDVTVTAKVKDNAGNSATVKATHKGGGIGVAPALALTAVFDGTAIDVTFSETMGAGVTSPSHYTLSGTGKGTLAASPSAVALLVGNTYRLTWASGEMFDGGDVTITASGAPDLAGNLANSSATDTGGATAVMPTVVSATVQTGLTVDVTFSEAMGISATAAANYTLSGSGQGSLAATPNTVVALSPTVYQLVWLAGDMVLGGDVTITVAGAQDLAGNPASGTATHVGGGIGAPPTLDAVVVQTGLTVDVTFNEPLGVGVTTAANYVVTGTGKGTLANNPSSVALVSGNTYRLTWVTGEMFNGGAITITATGVQDVSGNVSATSGTHAGGAIGVVPTLTAVAVQTGLTVDVTFSESMSASVTTASNYVVSGTGKGSLAANPTSVAVVVGNTYRLTWASGEMVNGGNITIASTSQDPAGNVVAASTTDTAGALGVVPTVTGVAVQSGLTVDVTFSEAMGTGVTTAANYTLSGTGKGSLTTNPSGVALVAGNTYRLTWASGEMYHDGDITIAVATAKDVAGNPVASSATDAGGATGTIPTFNTVAVQTGLTVDVTFSEAVTTGMTTAANYVVSGAGKGSLANNPSSVTHVTGNKYRLTWASGEMFNGGDITITGANILDAAGNAVASGGTDTAGGIGVIPTVTTVAVQTGLTVDVTFSEPMGSGVTTAANYTISGTGKGSLANNPTSVALVSGNKYRLTWAAGEMFNGGSITVTVANATDLAGNVVASGASHAAGAIGVLPTVSSVDVQTGLTVDVTFSEAMGTGVTTAANYTLTGTGKGSLATNPSSVALVSGNIYRLTWVAGEMFNGGNITIAVANAQDLVGNVISSSGTDTGGAIGVAPTVDTVVVQSGTTVDVTFSEAMNTGITTAANYTLSGTGKGTLATNPSSVALVSGNTYRLTWASGEMFIGGNITVAAANAQDFAGNVVTSNETDTSAGIGTAPTVSMTTSATSPTNLTLIPFTVTTSEATTNLVAGDLVVTNGSVSGFAGSGTSYSFNVTATGQGDVTVDLNTGVFTDAAGNPNSNAQSSTLTYDSIPPPSPTALNCVPGDNSVAVSWTTGGGDTLGFLAVRKYGSSPTWSPTPGTSYSNATTHSLDNYTHWLASAGAATSVTETEVFPGMPHYYAIYAYDAARNYQVAELDDCTPKPMAMLENIPPASFSGSALDVKVSGQSVTEYRYSLASSDYYCDEVSYSSWIPVATKITSVVDNGPYRLCVLGRTASLDEQVVASQTYFVKTAHVSIAHPNAMNSKVQKGDSFKIEWLDHNAADNGSGTLSFYYAASTGADCSAASSIVAGVSQNTANKWSNWDTTGVPTGTYYICIESFDGTSTHSFWANGTVTVEDYCVGGALTNTLISGSNGAGTVGDPYNICSLTQLLEMSTMTQTNKSYRLRRDIDASPTSGWNAGAGWEPRAYNFTKLDGNGYTVTGLFINRPSTDYVGLFSLNSGSTAIITDLRLTDVNITGADATGAISGRAEGSILRSFVSGTITGTQRVGAIVGTIAVSGVIVSSCASSATVNSNGIYHGGIVGSITVASALEKLHFSGALNSTSAVNVYLGGIIGSTSANITQCLMTGAIVNSASGSNTGGIAGVINGAGGVTISRCIYAGSITTAGGYVGGMVSTIGTTPLKILGSVNLGSISAASTQLGGFVGSAGSAPVKIVGSVFAGTITGSNSGNSVGGFVGANSTSIQSWLLASYGTGNVSGATYVGGIHGGSSSASLNFLIRGSWSSGSVACLGYCGGIVGLASGTNAAVLDAYSTASVAINGNYAGGAIGYLHANAKIANTYATGSISQTAAPDFYGAGFVGLCGIGGNIANSFSIGTSATSSAGGFGGQRYADCGAYTNVHWYKPGGNTFNCINNDAASGGTNCANHSATSYFQNSSNAPLSSWDFTTMWKFPVAAGYPILGWQYGS